MSDALQASREALSATTPLLDVSGLEAWYGESHILHGVTFDVRPGEVVTLLGRNGAGKTTTLKSIMGIVGKRKGSAKFEGKQTVGQHTDNPDLEAEGQKDQVAGDLKNAGEKAKDAFKD